MQSIDLGHNAYVEKTIVRLGPAISEETRNKLQQWRTTVLEKCQENHNLHQRHIKGKYKQSTDAANYLKSLKQHFVITHVDKLTHNLAFTCKLYYMHKLYTEIHSNAYTPTNRTLPNILRDHKNFNTKYTYKHTDVLPYLYAVPK